MKILIAYAGKTGTTEKCVKRLCEKLTNATAVDLNIQTPDIAQFDTVIVGGSIRMGQLHKKVKNFIDQNGAGLQSKKTAYFMCCCSMENVPLQFANNFPKELLDRAAAYECFGGEMILENLHGMDKLIAKMVTKANADKKLAPSKILDENIVKLAEKISN